MDFSDSETFENVLGGLFDERVKVWDTDNLEDCNFPTNLRAETTSSGDIEKTLWEKKSSGSATQKKISIFDFRSHGNTKDTPPFETENFGDSKFLLRKTHTNQNV